MEPMLALIEGKKHGEAHTPEAFHWLCTTLLEGRIPEPQLAAWLMAVCWRGMTSVESAAFTHALVASGATLSWPGEAPVVDKHSTGGVGDTTSLVLVPLVAAAGVRFVKMSGRALGHTGGTIDKLESIPKLRTDLMLTELRNQVARIGCALVRQSPELVPADGELYRLRDLTGTVDSLPLIAASILSKKIAAGADSIILDVKYGSGALMPEVESALRLAETMLRIGEAAGVRMEAVLTSMEEPLGSAVGNALEVAEAIETLQGGGPTDLRELTLELGTRLLVLSGGSPAPDEARSRLVDLLDSGLALERFARLIEAQGGDPGVIEDPELLPRAPVRVVHRAGAGGWLFRVDARRIAEIARALASRSGRELPDPGSGVRLLAKGGRWVDAGEPLAEIHAGDHTSAERAERALAGAFSWADQECAPTPFRIRPVCVGAPGER